MKVCSALLTSFPIALAIACGSSIGPGAPVDGVGTPGPGNEGLGGDPSQLGGATGAGGTTGPGPSNPQTGMVRFSFVPSWRSDWSQLDLTKFTHISYFHVTALPTGALDSSSIEPSKLDAFVAGMHSHGVNALVTVAEGAKLSAGLKNSAGRTRFISEVLDYVDTHRLDGVDLDWEPFDWAQFPNSEDTLGYGDLAKDLCRALHERNLICSADLYSSSYSGGLIPDELLDAIDFGNVMLYDYEGEWSKKTGHHARWSSCKAGLAYWESRGIARDRLVLGLPAYGRAFGDASGPNQSFVGLGSHSDGIWQYAEIAEAIEAGSLDVHENVAEGAYALSSSPLEVLFFLSAKDVAFRTDYAAKNGYRGMMLWDATMDATGEASLSSAWK